MVAATKIRPRQNLFQMRNVRNDHRPLMNQSSVYSDDYGSIRERKVTLYQQNNSLNLLEDESAFELVSSDMVNRSYDLNSFDGVTTESSVIEDDILHDNRRSCFDSLAKNGTSIQKIGGEMLHRVVKYNCSLLAKDQQSTKSYQEKIIEVDNKSKKSNSSKKKNGTKKIEKKHNTSDDRKSKLDEKNNKKPSNIFSLPTPRNKLLNDINDNALPRCDRPNNCHRNTSYYTHKNNRPYMEDKITIESLGSTSIIRDRPQSHFESNIRKKECRLNARLNFSSKNDSPPIISNYNSPKSVKDFDSFFSTTNRVDNVDASFFGIFDGHGGDQASQFCSEKMTSYLVNQKRFPFDLGSALKSTFRKMDQDYIASGNMDGTTACTCIVLGNQKIVCANAGDSRAIIVRSDGSVVQLSRDHKPGKIREVERIKKLGGNVIYKNRWRVEGLLSVSRAIGDAALKPYITSEPDTTEHIIGKSLLHSFNVQ